MPRTFEPMEPDISPSCMESIMKRQSPAGADRKLRRRRRRRRRRHHDRNREGAVLFQAIPRAALRLGRCGALPGFIVNRQQRAALPEPSTVRAAVAWPSSRHGSRCRWRSASRGAPCLAPSGRDALQKRSVDTRARQRRGCFRMVIGAHVSSLRSVVMARRDSQSVLSASSRFAA